MADDPYAAAYVKTPSPAKPAATDPYAAAYTQAPAAPAASDPYAAAYTQAPAAPAASDPYASAYAKPPAAASPPAAQAAPTRPAKPGEDLPVVGHLVRNLNDVAAERTAALKHDVTTKPQHGMPLRVAKTAVDVAGYALGPIDAAARTVVGEPVAVGAAAIDKAIGKGTSPELQERVKKNIGDVASMAFPLDAVGKATGVAEKVPAAFKVLEKIASPATVNDEAKAAANMHRHILGKRGIEADKAAYNLGKHQRIVGNASPEDQRRIIQYVENRSKGGVSLPERFKPAADAIRTVAEGYRKQIEYVLGKDGPSFVQDYYARMWKQKPDEVVRAMSKQGSGKSLKARSLPTYEDGLKAGLTPVHANPLDAMTAYSENMGRFLATHEILDGMKSEKAIGAKFFAPGKQPEGWVPLNGVKTRTPERLIVQKGKGTIGRQGEQVMYAPEGAARVYNNYISKGLESSDTAGGIYRGARAAANGLVQLKLGLSAFHGAVMGQEGIISEMARGLKQVSRGDAGGLKTMAASPAAPISTYRRGSKMADQILGKAAPSEFDAKLNKIYEKTGARLGMDKIYATRDKASLFASTVRGTLLRDLGDALKATYTGSAGSRAKGVIDLAGNLIQSTAAPLFEHYIPNVKRGAWAQQMSDFLKANPNASEAEQVAYGQKLQDTIDNRFGELVVNNNFWNKSAYQVAQLLLLSPSWNIGTAREIGGGIIEIPKSLKGVVEGKGVTDKTAYVAALVGTTMLENAVATKLHTGQDPEGADFFAYRTGGTDPATGKPERAMLPGYMKDVLAWSLEGPGKEAANKLNPGLQAAASLLTNKDYKNQPIRDINAPAETQAGQVAGYAAEQASPIAFGESSKPKKGSKLSGPERALAIRPAARYITDPQGVKAMEGEVARRGWNAKTRTEQRMKAREADQ